MIRPPALRRGDLVRVIAPASPFDRARFERGVNVLREDLGFRVAWRPDVFSATGYLAGDDDRRTKELVEAFADPGTRGVMCARGGYGTPRILARLDFAALVKRPKVFVGFSDVTALLLAFQRAGMVTFHGPMATGRMSDAEFSRDDGESFVRTVGEATPSGLVGEGRVLVAGDAEGPLVGGNLAMICATMGTPWSILAKGAILFLEDVGEKPYRIDRMLTQLELAGVLGDCAGLAFGRFSGCENPADPAQKVDDVIAAIAKRAGKPAVAGLPFGHGGENRTLPLGVRGRLSGGVLSVIEAAVLEEPSLVG